MDLLDELPDRLDAIEVQLLQQRREMHDGFSAIRDEIKAMDDDLRAEMHALHHLTIERIGAGDAETRRYMRVIAKEFVARIETMGEGRRTRKKR